MTNEHLEKLMAWMDEYKDVGLSFGEVEDSSTWVIVSFHGLKFAPYKMRLNLANAHGHVESTGDYEINQGGSTCYGTMWDEDDSERRHGDMPFLCWVNHYLARMAKVIRENNDSLMFVGGTYNC